SLRRLRRAVLRESRRRRSQRRRTALPSRAVGNLPNGIERLSRARAVGRSLGQLGEAELVASPAQEVRFRLEAELAARVQHPHIVQVYEIGSYQVRPFLAMEWVEGGSL